MGDKLQINGSGLWYTVVGPMNLTPQHGNSELFVNVGPPGTTQTYYSDLQAGQTVQPEFLFLVNGKDDNGNGWIDEGWDGLDNNLNQELANGLTPIADDLLEWEDETWPPSFLQLPGPPSNVPYTIQRRPAPVANSREVALPTNVVVDMTMLLGSLQPSPTGVQTQLWPLAERSQFPNGVINPFTGYVDILVNTNGSVVPTTIYSTPASMGLSGAFYHFWLSERRCDVAAPSSTATQRSLTCRSGT